MELLQITLFSIFNVPRIGFPFETRDETCVVFTLPLPVWLVLPLFHTSQIDQFLHWWYQCTKYYKSNIYQSFLMLLNSLLHIFSFEHPLIDGELYKGTNSTSAYYIFSYPSRHRYYLLIVCLIGTPRHKHFVISLINSQYLVLIQKKI